MKIKLREFIQRPIFKKLINPVVRGLVKQIPFIGTPIVEVATNVIAENGQPKKHNWLSIGVQVTIAIATLYAFYTGGITLEDLAKFLQQFI